VKNWWRRRNVRLSLTLWYCGATVVVLALYAGSVFTIVSRNLGELVHNVVAHLGVRAEEKGQSRTIDRPGLPLALRDRFMLRQALINIVDNAVTFTGVGGKIRIRVQEFPAGAIIDVSDTEPGVASELRARILDRHQSGK
jgi:signal transduction histidine kinase